MRLDVHSLPDDPTELKHIIATLSSSYQDKLHHLEEQVRLLRNEIFGRKSEKHLPPQNERQQRLFDETDGGSEAEEASPSQGQAPILVAPHQRRKAGRKPLPADLPRIEVIHDIPESEKQCACGTPLSRIGEEVCEKLDIIPAKVRVIRHIRYKYACKGCEGVESLAPTVLIAPLPPQLIPKTMATAGLLAHIVVSKFEDALPFHRQSKQLARLGIDLPRATLCNWARQVAERASPLADLMDRAIREGPIVNIDETTVQVLQEPGRSDTQKSYMWIFRGGDPERPVLRYQYHPTRAGSVPLNYLEGFKGYVQTDGYNGYDALGRKPGIVMVGCWAHARRKFHEVLKAASVQVAKRKLAAEEALEFIGKLYRIEKEARAKELPAPALCELRQQQAEPVLAEFKRWLEEKAPLTPPGGLLGKAIGYTLNQWPRLIAYLQDGRLRPDNNLVENAIRPFVVGRKNWLFSGHPRGAAASAFLYSLIETAKANGFKPYAYLRYLFDQLPLATTEDDYRSLLPPYMDASRLNSAAA
jgi:transposase